MNTSGLKIGVGVAVAGLLGLGVWLGLNRGAESAAVSAVAVRQDEQTREIARLREENRRLQDEVRRLSGERTPAAPAGTAPARADVGPADSLARLRLLTDLYQRGVVTFSARFLTGEGKLTPEFVELFGLTPAEKALLDQATSQAKQQAAALTLANTSVGRDADGNLVIDVKPFAEGAALYDQLRDTIVQTLGPERSEAFAAFEKAARIEESMGLGAQQRTVTLTREVSSSSGKVTYTVQDRTKRPNSSSSSTRKNADRENLAAQLGDLARLLPSDF